MLKWNILYNMTILRVISFCLDKNWQSKGIYKFDMTKHQPKCEFCKVDKICYKAHSEQYLDGK